MRIVSSAPGKVILSGEHAVVYGEPAIVAAVQMRTRVFVKEGRKESKARQHNNLIESVLSVISEQAPGVKTDKIVIEVETTLPIGSGLGSSASLAASIVGGISAYFHLGWDREKINDVTYLAEKMVHGNPSGVDNTAVVYGGLLRFERGMQGEANILQNLTVHKILQKIWLIDSGKPEETTGEMVGQVREQYIKNPVVMTDYFARIGSISRTLQYDLEHDKFSPDWIGENERLLEQLGVVGERAKKIIADIEKLGGYAKVCGAGGVKSGSGVLLAYHPDDAKFEQWLRSRGYTYFQDHIGGEGWRIDA